MKLFEEPKGGVESPPNDSCWTSPNAMFPTSVYHCARWEHLFNPQGLGLGRSLDNGVGGSTDGQNEMD